MASTSARRALAATIRASDSYDAACNACHRFSHDHGAMGASEAIRFSARFEYDAEDRMGIVDRLMGHHGVESFESYNGTWEYSNSGDAYSKTVLLSPGGRLVVASYGSIVERPRHSAYASSSNA